MRLINKNIIFNTADNTQIEEKIIEYFKESGFRVDSIQNGNLIFSRGSILTNLFTFNPLKWKSKISVEIIEREVKIDASINTIGQTVIAAEENLWNVFLNNLKLFLVDNINYKEVNNKVLKSTKKEAYKFVEEITIGTSEDYFPDADRETKYSLRNNQFLNWLIKFIVPILLVSILYLLYTGSLDIWLYDKILSWLAGFVIFFGVPATIYWTIRLWIKSDARRLIALIFTGVSVFVFAILFVYWSDKHEEEIYSKNGIITKAIVTKTFMEENESKRMYYEFTVNDIKYESFNVYNEKGHFRGDTIEIIYNRSNPKMNEALELLDN